MYNYLNYRICNKQNKEFNSTISDLKISSNLALYHSRRIPAAVSYNLFELTNDVSMLFDAIAFECKAIEAWRLLITAAGDVYVINLIMGVRNPDLCGHWKDELHALEKGLKHWNRNGLDLNRKKWLPKLGITVQQQLQRMIACLKSLISL